MKPSVELINLINKSLDKSITRVEMARLEELLENDSNLNYYLDMVAVEAALPHLNSNQITAATLLAKPSRKWQPWMTAAAAGFAIFATGIATGLLLSPSQTTTEIAKTEKTRSPVAASITSLVGVTWTNGAPENLDLTKESDIISMDSGLIEITFDSGVRTLIEGPASFRITGGNDAYLTQGKMVADVPDGAEGFTVNYRDGKVVDLGTEFALNVPGDENPVEVGVFRGEVEVYQGEDGNPLKILENHAVAYGGHPSQDISSIPFDRDQYIRDIPSRELPWTFPKVATTERSELTFDITHLLWKAGNYQAVIKWMNGRDSIHLHSAQIRRNGEMISEDIHEGSTGVIRLTDANVYHFNIPERPSRSDKWTLHISVSVGVRETEEIGTFIPESSGTVLFEDEQSLTSSEKAFLGTWEYRHGDNIHRRTFLPDHTATYQMNGELTEDFQNATWKVEDGVLILSFANPDTGEIYLKEFQCLRDEQELLFLNLPYRNGYRVE